MSRSARRLAASVTTHRFDWQSAGPPAGSHLVPLVFADAGRVARTPSDGRHDVEARELHLPSVAAERIEQIEQQAFDRGYARGQDAAGVELERRIDGLVKDLSATIGEIGALGPEIMRRSDRELIHLAVAMAERIVRREIKGEPGMLLDIARAAIERLGERNAAVVHLHPADHAAVRQGATGRIGSLDVVANPDVERGGCLIRSALGSIDAGVGAQMRELLRALLTTDDSEEAADGPIAGH